MRVAKRYVGLAVILPAIALASACGGGSDDQGSAIGGKASGVVHFWARSATANVAKQMAKDFNAAHRGVRVEVTETQIGQAVTKLGTAIRAGSPPDVIGLNDINMPIFTHNGSLKDLTKYVKALPYADALSKGHLRLAQYQGHTYGLPYLADLSVLWYNKKLFSKAGLDPNKPPKNFADILNDARKIDRLGHGISGFGLAGNCQGCLGFTVLPSIWAANGRLIKGSIGSQTANIAGNKALKRTLQLYRTIWTEHLTAPSDRTENGTTWGKDFAAGKVGIFPGSFGISIGNGAGSAQQMAKTIGVTPLPGPDGGYSTFDGGDDFAIPKGAKNPAGAWEFITFVLQEKEQLKYPPLGFTPVRGDLLDASFKKKFPFDAVALKALGHGYVPSTLAYNTAFNASGSPWFKTFSAAVYDGKFDAALKSGQSSFTSTLKQSGSAS